jgi:hypothetical protein
MELNWSSQSNGVHSSEDGMELESQELEDVQENTDVPIFLNIVTEKQQTAQSYKKEDALRYKQTVMQMVAEPAIDETFATKFFDMVSVADTFDDEAMDTSADLFSGLAIDVKREIETIHNCLRELLRHFWMCFPAATSEAEFEEKLHRMNQTLAKFKENKLEPLESKYGSYLQHCYVMLEKANEKYTQFVEWKKRRR